MSVDDAASPASNTFTNIVFAASTLGNSCASLVSYAWQTVGFVFSSLAACPTFCADNLHQIWMTSCDYTLGLVTNTSPKSFLGVTAVCFLYLAVSNICRYVYSRGKSMLPARLRGQDARRNTHYMQFDRNFESDFEYSTNSDTEDTSTVNPTSDSNSDTDDSNYDGDDVTNTDDISDVDNNDSDEYTVVMDDSDSDTSFVSHALSVESSDQEIEVQLPPLDEHYALRNRSSTPSLVPKTIKNDEEFSREMEKERDKRKCVVCHNLVKSVLILPCRHLCLCVICADQIVKQRASARRVCPLCRAKITKVMNIYV